MIQVDSRKVQPGDTFIALRGVDIDGHMFIPKAIENGATKIICEKGNFSVTTEIVPDTRAYLANYLKEENKEMMSKIKLIGITGTNGKTTSAFLVHKAFYLLGIRSAYIGTIGFYMNEKIRSLNNTTPDLFDLYAMFKEAYEKGAKVIVLEVSSQGISYGRVRDITFDIGIFTNLTQDHLDYHKTMENYALAKQQLFKNIKDCAIINYDDEYKNYYLLDQNLNITYGFEGGDYKITHYKMGHQGTIFEYINPTGMKYSVKTSLIGKYNLYNLLAVIITLKEYGVSEEKIIDVIPQLKSPSGRMDTIEYRTNTIIVDYAHTADAVEKIIRTVREVSKGRIITAFGCTGDRDRTKRPIMMKIVSELSDHVIITSDDLHSEEFEHIVSDMLNGFHGTNYEVISDRPKAILKGISLLKENDVLLILGKGHEEYMIVKDERIPMNDRNIVENAIKDKIK